MNAKGLIAAVVLIGVAITGGLWLRQDSGREAMQASAKGDLYVGVTDASADIKNVDDIRLTVDKVELRSVSGAWVTVSEEDRTYNLLSLKANGNVELYAEEALEAGLYDRARVTLGDVIVDTKANGDVEAVLPASQVVLNAMINVRADEDAHLELDFLADKSLHAAAGGKYVFAAVVDAEARSNAEVSVGADNVLAINGGRVDSMTRTGLDLNGASRENFVLATDSTFQVRASVPAVNSGANANAGANGSNANTNGGASADVAANANGAVTFVLGGQSYAGASAGQVIDSVTTGDVSTPGVALPISGPVNLDAHIDSTTNGSAPAGGSGVNVNTNGGLNLGY